MNYNTKRELLKGSNTEMKRWKKKFGPKMYQAKSGAISFW